MQVLPQTMSLEEQPVERERRVLRGVKPRLREDASVRGRGRAVRRRGRRVVVRILGVGWCVW